MREWGMKGPFFPATSTKAVASNGKIPLLEGDATNSSNSLAAATSGADDVASPMDAPAEAWTMSSSEDATPSDSLN